MVSFSLKNELIYNVIPPLNHNGISFVAIETALGNLTSLDIPSLGRIGDDISSEHSSHVSLTVPASCANTYSNPTSTATSDIEDRLVCVFLTLAGI